MAVRDAPVLEVAGLHVSFRAAAGPAVAGADLAVHAGRCVALVGGSGSGKSVTARSVVGLVGRGARVRAATLRLCGQDLRSLTPRQWRRVRGGRVGLVLQDALVSLDPLRPVGREIDDALRLHTRLGPAQRRRRMLAALAEAGIPDPELRAGQRSGELSGGLRQRALIAAAIALHPPLIIADEPTTALDVPVQRHVLASLRALRDGGTAVLFITHDLGVAAAVSDRIAVMHDGRIVETGPTERVLAAPQDPYTRRLLRARPAGRPRGLPLLGAPAVTAPRPGAAVRVGSGPAGPGRDGAPSVPVLELRGVTRSFHTGRITRKAVDDVSLRVLPGRTLGLVGESGSGKTTTARIALGLTVPDAGVVLLQGRPWVPGPERERRARRRLLGAVYQDPFSSFDPRWSVGRILADAVGGGEVRASAHAARVAELLGAVGLPEDAARRLPRDLSGGQRQRVAIARAIAPRPAVLICDEPVSSLDVLVQAQILDLLDGLQRRLHIGCLFISHDLDVVRHVSDTVAVMHDGRIVEHGDTERVFDAPAHGYSRRLLAASLDGTGDGPTR